MARVYWLFLITALNLGLGFGQRSIDSTLAFEKFEEYNALPRELIYVHLNKSIYSKGETLGFTVYVFDKNEKKLSTLTRNIYCVITDSQNRTLKSKMILITNGVGSGNFFVDEILNSGNFTFKAFTNYQKNFEEQNYYVQNFRVITDIPKEVSENEIELDVQFLPESGHFVRDIENTLGIIIKDSQGLGVPDLDGHIKDETGRRVRNFKTDEFGIAKTSFKIEPNLNYQAEIVFKKDTLVYNLGSIESKGIQLSLLEIRDKLALDLKTNEETLGEIQDKTFSLSIHNGKAINAFTFNFKEARETKFINLEDLFPGINIFTLFNSEGRPILERMYFNYNGIEMLKAESSSANKIADSIEVKVKFQNLDTIKLQNFSISVLPRGTESYLPSHNILSYLFLQPYVKGYLENAFYYFTDIDERTKRQLDNLLLTQGWSSYDWNFMFNHTPKYIHQFENGITVEAHLNQDHGTSYYLSTGYSSDFIEVDQDSMKFRMQNLFPFEKDDFYISEINRSGRTSRPSLYVQFYPSKIPEFKNYVKIMPRKQKPIEQDPTFQPIIETSWTGIEQLDEVVLNYKKRKSELEKLKESSFGIVDIFTKADKNRFQNFASYLATKGYRVTDQYGTYTITRNSVGNLPSSEPIVVIDGNQLMDYSFLSQLSMSVVEYVVIDRQGGTNVFSQSAPGGVIQIFTNPNSTLDYSRNTTAKFDVPLGFSESKKFYAPIYSFYQTQFFTKYGVIDWQPHLKVNKNGEITFRFADKGYTDFTIFIEGYADGKFISDKRDLQLED